MSQAGPMADAFDGHLALLHGLPEHPQPALATLFARGVPIYVARAPGRLDVMGGIADYSGSLVLELPLADAAFAAVQRVEDDGVTVASMLPGGDPRYVKLSPHEWAELRHADYPTARQLVARDPDTAWSAYVIGPVLVLLRETGASWRGGLRILIDSHVPEGKGVSSSAALEVATARAFAESVGLSLGGDELARLCQLAENHIAGAPCGIMDQMTAALGREGELLALRCQPANVERYVPIPRGVAFWGIDSGVRHAVSGSNYSSVRCGAFMGYRMIAHAAGLRAQPTAGVQGLVAVDDPRWNGYLANLSPAEFQHRFADLVPHRMRGDEFLQRFGGTTDQVTRVEPLRVYPVYHPTRHPIEENQRAGRFRELLTAKIDNNSLNELGHLMAASHASYSACGLGAQETDLLVELVRAAPGESGLFGAKITGGGSGGTVAVIGRPEADGAIQHVAKVYEKTVGRSTRVFRGSSPGACATRVRRMVL